MMHAITLKLLPASIAIVTTVALFSREASPNTMAPPVVPGNEKSSRIAVNQASREAAACNRSDFKVAVDVGHNKDTKGAESARARIEYFFNLELAKRIEKSLTNGGFRNTYLIQGYGGQDDELDDRIKKANARVVNLFIQSTMMPPR